MASNFVMKNVKQTPKNILYICTYITLLKHKYMWFDYIVCTLLDANYENSNSNKVLKKQYQQLMVEKQGNILMF